MKRREQESSKTRDSDRQGTSDEGKFVSADENPTGTIEFDVHGDPRWKWITEMDGGTEDTADQTFDYLKALDNSALTIADEAVPHKQDKRTDRAGGYNPYDAVPKPKKHTRRR